MTVICENCRTGNRDRAKFCIGCAGKLPGFAATSPAAPPTPEGMRRHRQHPRGGTSGTLGTSGTPSSASRQAHERPVLRWWFAAVLLLGGLAAGLVGWIALTPGRTPAATAMAATTAPPATAPGDTATGAVSFESALSPGESPVANGAAPSRPVDATADIAPVPALQESVLAPSARPASARAQTARTGGNGRADPRTGCAHLFFAFAARCEANHCAEAAYARHPRCDVVRAERQRDDARRNMTSGY